MVFTFPFLLNTFYQRTPVSFMLVLLYARIGDLTQTMQPKGLPEGDGLRTWDEVRPISPLTHGGDLDNILNAQQFAFLNCQRLIPPADIGVRILQPFEDIVSTTEYDLVDGCSNGRQTLNCKILDRLEVPLHSETEDRCPFVDGCRGKYTTFPGISRCSVMDSLSNMR